MTKKPISEVYKPEVRKDVKIDGISLESVKAGEKFELTTKAAFSSYDADFQHYFDSLLSSFVPIPQLHSANHLLIHIRPDNTAYIYHHFPFGMKIRSVAAKPAGSVLFQHEISDIEAVIFEDDVSYFDYNKDDKIIYLFRSRWSFGLYFNFARKQDFDEIAKDLGYFHKILDYYEVYHFLDSSRFRADFESDGWFPFAALIRFDLMKFLINFYRNGKSNDADLEILKSSITSDLLNKLVDTWWGSPVFLEKKPLLQAGIDSFLQGNQAGYVGCIKILVSEIEGILRFTFPQTKGRKIQPFLKELASQGVSKYDAIRTLLFPTDFVVYIERTLFADFDLEDPSAPANRHPISHGVTGASKFTWERALQIILTIDQLRFLT